MRWAAALELALLEYVAPETARLMTLRAAELLRELTAHPDAVLTVLRRTAPSSTPTTPPPVPARTRTREALGLPPWRHPAAPPRSVRDPWE